MSIVGEKEGSARYHSDLSDEDRNSYSNLILLCSHHHDIIDKDEKTYSIELLQSYYTKSKLTMKAGLQKTYRIKNPIQMSLCIPILSIQLQLC
ncbi:MAG: hypothetical protein FJ241_11605 [Nitrospira sp.]|nr:hypothetical protein [Nitrospira sp.]